MDRRRLDAECIRDAMLSVSGQLDLTPRRPDVSSPTSPPTTATSTPTPAGASTSPVFRNALPEVFEAFDFADPSMRRRPARTSAPSRPQALFLMNHPFVREQAEAAAARLLAETGLDDDARLTRRTA